LLMGPPMGPMNSGPNTAQQCDHKTKWPYYQCFIYYEASAIFTIEDDCVGLITHCYSSITTFISDKE